MGSAGKEGSVSPLWYLFSTSFSGRAHPSGFPFLGESGFTWIYFCTVFYERVQTQDFITFHSLLRVPSSFRYHFLPLKKGCRKANSEGCDSSRKEWRKGNLDRWDSPLKGYRKSNRDETFLGQDIKNIRIFHGKEITYNTRLYSSTKMWKRKFRMVGIP